MALTIRSPNGRLALEIAYRRKAGRELPALRVLLDGNTLLAWSFFPIAERGVWEMEDTAGARALLAKGGKGRGGRAPLCHEASLSFVEAGGRRRVCVLRVADDAVAILPESLASPLATPLLRLPGSLSHALACVEDADRPSGMSVVRVSASEIAREPNGASPLFLAYEHGKTAFLIRHELTGSAFLVAADRPADAILPRTLRHVAEVAPARLRRALSDQISEAILAKVMSLLPTDIDGQLLGGCYLPRVDAAYDVNSVWIEAGYWRDTLHAAGFLPPMFFQLADPEVAGKGRNAPLSDAPRPTRAHSIAFHLLTMAECADAATAFRGEVGEYLAGARRKGRVWYVAGFTAKLRVLTLFFPFLEEGVAYDAEWICDEGCGPAPVEPLPSADELRAGDAVTIRMAPSGGFIAKLTPRGGA